VAEEIVADVVRKYVNLNRATALLVSHDLNPVKSIADEIIKMRKGKIVEVKYM